MILTEMLTSPWAILPEKLFELQAIHARHVRGEVADLRAIEANLGRPLENEQQGYVMRAGGIAVLEVAGVISPKANMFTRVSGGASAALLASQINKMALDPKVIGAVIDWDTPGGNVLGIPALAQSIRRLAAAKPTVSVSTGTMASAGYWAGCAANAVYISGLTDNLGSLGVVATHRYDPRSTAVTTTEISVGRYKRMASENAPLTAEGEAYIRTQLDEVYRVMVNTVAENRGVSVDDVLSRMADGRLFIGQQAIDAGLADGVATVDDLVKQMATDPSRFAKRRPATPARQPAAHRPAVTRANAAGGNAAPRAAVQAAAVAAPPTREQLMIKARGLAAAISAVRLEAAARGRQISATEALAEVEKRQEGA